MRQISAFESRAIKAYFSGVGTESVRYTCVRAKEHDDKLGSQQDTDYFLAALELSNAIREELGLAPAALTEMGEMSAPPPVTANAPQAVEQESAPMGLDRYDIIEAIGLPDLAADVKLSLKNLKKLLYTDAHKVYLADLGLPPLARDIDVGTKLTIKSLIKFIYAE
jgi:hypothetical protein